MSIAKNNEKSDYSHYLQIAQFYNSLINRRQYQENLPAILLQKIIDNGINVNYKIQTEFDTVLHDENCAGYTLLHFSAHERNLDSVKILLNSGADYTIPSDGGETPLHMVGKTTWFQKENHVERTDQSSVLSIINCIFSKHVENKNSVNPKCKNGISHFHIACGANNIQAVKFFLQAGVPVNLAVNHDSPKYAGFTSLHFAVDSLSLETLEILLLHGADVHSKDAKNVSALHSLIENYKKMIDNNKSKTSFNFEAETKKYKAMIDIILKHLNKDFSNYTDNTELTGCHIASTLGDDSVMKQLLKHNVDVHAYVSNDSPIWPGYTALHFAAHFNPEIVKLLIQNGFDILTKDANGITPLDLCLEKYSPELIYSILSLNNEFKDLLLSDNITKLMDLILSMKNLDTFENFLENLTNVNIIIPSNSPLWPGFSPLHLAIIMRNSDDDYLARIKACLKKGIPVNSKSADGLTSIQFALKLKHKVVIEDLLKYRKQELEQGADIQEDDSLNFLISCTIQDKEIFDIFIKKGIDVNSSAKSCFEWYEPYRSNFFFHILVGWTPLHVATYYRDFQKVKILLDQNANPNAADGNGVTAIHLSLKHYIFPDDKKNAKLLLSKDLKNKVTCNSFSHLHIAAFADNEMAIEEYLKQGADINAVIQYEELKDFLKELSFLSRSEGFTPLQIAVLHHSYKAIETLLNHGAKIHVENSSGWLNVFSSMISIYFDPKFIVAFKETYLSMDVIDESSNFTILHFACSIFNKEMIIQALENGPDVNTRIVSDSERLWNGFTPMHILMKRIVEVAIDGENLEEIMNLLLDAGADVTVGDAENGTPIHWAHHSESVEGINFGCDAIGLLLKSQTSYDINPTDSDGFSHLHIASSMNKVDIIEEFLKNGINVNQPVKPFQKYVGGHTALYFAIFHHKEEAARVLLKYGADVTVQNFEGNTPLHIVVKEVFLSENTVNAIVSAGADIHMKNIRFETPLELLLKSESIFENNIFELVKLFLNLGYCLTDFNPVTSEGFLAVATNTCSYGIRRNITKLIETIESSAVLNLDQNDSNAIHNIVSIYKPNIPSTNYIKAIQTLIEIGCNINHQNKQGKTPLHVAADFKNVEGAKSLLSLGADRNIADIEGNTPILDFFDN